jgi:hypothetical protein
MKTIRIVCTWESTHEVEVPDDYVVGGTLDDEWCDQVDPHNAELWDWEEI